MVIVHLSQKSREDCYAFCFFSLAAFLLDTNLDAHMAKVCPASFGATVAAVFAFI